MSEKCPDCGIEARHVTGSIADRAITQDSIHIRGSIACIRRQFSQLRAAAKKLRQCFPDEMPEGVNDQEFAIPRYVVEELDAALEGDRK